MIAVAAIIGAFFAFVQPLASSIRQGLDLQGGTHVVLEAVDTEQAQVNDDAMNRVVAIMEKRVNSLGLTEPIIQREGERRVIIELPGIKDRNGPQGRAGVDESADGSECGQPRVLR